MTMNITPRVTARVDRALLNAAGRSVRHFVIEIETPQVRDAGQERSAQNVALVIDRSGSMSGDRLEAAKLAALSVLDQLRPTDRLSIVSFDNEARVELPSMMMTQPIVEQARTVVRLMQSGGSTDLFAGYCAGADQVSRNMFERGEGQNRVIVLSDGHANCGLLDVERIAEHASALAERNLFTSTIGIGNGYEARFLQALAAAGGGEMHDAEHPGEISEVLLGEVFRSSPVSCVDGKLALFVEGGRQLSVVGLQNGHMERVGDGAKIEVPVGALRSGSRLRIVIRARFGSAPAGAYMQATPTVTARRLEGGALQMTADPVNLEHVERRNLGDGRHDLEACSHAARAIRDFVQREAADLNRRLESDGIRELVERELPVLRRIVKGLPEGPELIDDLETIAARAERIWDERLRKDMEVGAYKAMACSAEYRSEARDGWKERLR